MNPREFDEIPFPLVGFIWPGEGFKEGATDICMGHYAMLWQIAAPVIMDEPKIYALYLNSQGKILGLGVQAAELTEKHIQEIFLFAEVQIRIGPNFLPEELCDSIHQVPFPELSKMCDPEQRKILHKMIALEPKSRIPWLDREMRRYRSSQLQQTSPVLEDYGHDNDPFDGLSPGDVFGPEWKPGNDGRNGR